MLVYVSRERKLNQNAMHTRVIIRLGDLLEDLGLRNGLGEFDDVTQDICLNRDESVTLWMTMIELNRTSSAAFSFMRI